MNQLLILLACLLYITFANGSELSAPKRSPIGTMRFGKRAVEIKEEDNDDPIPYIDQSDEETIDSWRYVKRNYDNIPVGTMRFGKRGIAYGRLPFSTMRFGKRDDGLHPVGTMRFGKRDPPFGTMRFGKRNPNALGTMRFGK